MWIRVRSLDRFGHQQATDSHLPDKAQFTRIVMDQLDLFTDDDRPERFTGWIYNPSAPATDDELRAFLHEMAEQFRTEPEDAA